VGVRGPAANSLRTSKLRAFIAAEAFSSAVFKIEGKRRIRGIFYSEVFFNLLIPLAICSIIILFCAKQVTVLLEEGAEEEFAQNYFSLPPDSLLVLSPRSTVGNFLVLTPTVRISCPAGR
jgi:hypothetical protein